MFPHLTENQQSRVAEEVQAFISQAMQGASFKLGTNVGGPVPKVN